MHHHALIHLTQGATAAAAAPVTDAATASAAALSLQRIDKGPLEACLCVVVQALAVVMAGTGGVAVPSPHKLRGRDLRPAPFWLRQPPLLPLEECELGTCTHAYMHACASITLANRVES